MKIGIITDIHEDITSLKEAFTVIEKNNCNEIICLGDITGYDKVYNSHIKNPDASECVTAVRQNCKYAVIGNHDLYSIRKLPVSNPGFDFPGNWYSLDIKERILRAEGKVWTYENETPSIKLTKEDKEYLDSLPEYLIIEFDNIKILFSHSVYPDLTGSLVFRPHNPWNLKEHKVFSKNQKCAFSFSGHMHPAGFVRADINDIKLLSFRNYKMKNIRAHYFCPCIAGGKGKNGVIIIDLKEMTIEAVSLFKSPFRRWSIGTIISK